ncbi:serine/threonine-protein kinase [Actinomadura sp. 9N407]|uniref:serine/threonine-protein kinase n=1 Tax=Actinomadura sp. 9N407 TaxID=3375154 RepID=UPI00379343C3
MSENWRVDGFTEVRELGAGAQGRVVLARHATAGTPVAIKYLSRREEDGTAIDQLREEAVMLGRVTDPHVVRLYRFVAGEQGAALVMEAVNGVSLKELLTRYGALGPEAALTVLKGSLLGLAAAHEVGVVHRDYKPANVVVQADGLSKLIDFGIAGFSGEGARSGTPAYMAPEQWNGEPASPATDVYAATCVFFECVTGRRPYEGKGLGVLREGHLNTAPPVEAVPGPLRALVARGMAKAAEQRPYGAAEFVAELESAATAAYGPGWEQRGVRAMAGAAVALAALFPLIAAGLMPAASAGVAGTAAAGSAAGAGAAGAGAGAAGAGAGAGAAGAGAAGAGGGAAAGGAGAGAASGAGAAGGAGGVGAVAGTSGGGIFAAASTKIVATVAATTLAAGGAGAYVVGTGGGDAPPAAAALVPVSAKVVTANRPAGGGSAAASQQYVTISGHRDNAVEKRINAALRAASDTGLASYRKEYAGREDVQEVHSTAQVTLSTKRLLSVSYGFGVSPKPGSFGNWVKNFTSGSTVVIDLSNGRTLGAADLFKATTFQPAGLTALADVLKRGDRCLRPDAPFLDEPLKPFRFKATDLHRPGSAIQVDLRPKEVNVEIAVERLDMTMSGQVCQTVSVAFPVGELARFMTPLVVDEMRSATPTPSPSGTP